MPDRRTRASACGRISAAAFRRCAGGVDSSRGQVSWLVARVSLGCLATLLFASVSAPHAMARERRNARDVLALMHTSRMNEFNRKPAHAHAHAVPDLQAPTSTGKPAGHRGVAWWRALICSTYAQNSYAHEPCTRTRARNDSIRPFGLRRGARRSVFQIFPVFAISNNRPCVDPAFCVFSLCWLLLLPLLV